MREFKTACIDSVTKKAMVLSECTYNMACDWLERMLKKHELEICKVHYDIKNNITELYSGHSTKDSLNLGKKYYYDETRGYLLSD